MKEISKTSALPVKLILSVASVLLIFFVGMIFIRRYQDASGDVMRSLGGCNCYTERLQMEILGVPPAIGGRITLIGDEPILRSCIINICNCMDSDADIGRMRLRYGTENFEDRRNNHVRLVDVSTLASGSLSSGNVLRGNCKEIFNLFEKEGVFPGDENDNGKLFVRLEYDGTVVSEYEWNIAHRPVYEV